MKRKLLIWGVFALLVLISFVSFYTLTRETVDWNFIQKVGGIKTDAPLKTEDGYYLPVICNVSGSDSVTVKPTALNSALSCLKIKSTIKDNTIHVEIISGIAISKRDGCQCKAVRIGELEPGSYIVYYGGKSSFEHQIGKFTIE